MTEFFFLIAVFASEVMNKFNQKGVRNNIKIRMIASQLMFLVLACAVSSCVRELVCAKVEMYASGDVTGGQINLQSDWKPVKSHFMLKLKRFLGNVEIELSGPCFEHATGQKRKRYRYKRKFADSTDGKGYDFIRMHCMDTSHINYCVDLFETKTESYLVFKSDDNKRIYKVKRVEPGDFDYPFKRKKARLF